MPRNFSPELKALLAQPWCESHSTLAIYVEPEANSGTTASLIPYYLSTAAITVDGLPYQARLSKDAGSALLRQSLGVSNDRAEIAIEDADGAMRAEFAQWGSAIQGAKVELGRAWRNLDTGQWHHYTLMKGIIHQPSYNSRTIQLSIISEHYAGGSVGGGRVVTRSCQWQFKGRECGYSGAETACNKLYGDAGGCSGRSNQHRYGGFIQLQGINAVNGASGLAAANIQTREEIEAISKSLLRWIHVTEDYGADPTGVADSWEAFQRAINASCNGTDNRPVYFAGAFKITRPLTWPTADVDKTMRLFGAGRSSSVIVYTGTGSLFTDVGDNSLTVRLAATANVNISNPGTSTFDSTVASSGDRILLKNQSATSQNGVYVFNGSGSAMTRATDADAWGDFFCQFVTTTAGVTQANKIYRCQADTVGTLGTTAITYQVNRRNDHLCFDGFSVYSTSGSNTGNCWDFSSTNGDTVQTGLQVKNCYVQDFGGYAYYARNTQSSVIEGCHFRGQKKGGIAFDDNNLGSFAIAPNANRIINNQIDNLNYASGTSAAAINLYGSNGTTVQGNTIQGHWFDAPGATADVPAIRVSNSNGVLLANNWIESSITNTTAAISIQYSRGVTLVACVGSGLHQIDVEMIGANGTSLHGCSFENGVTNILVDSTCHNTSVYGGNLAGPSNINDASPDGVKTYNVNYGFNDNTTHQFKWSNYARDTRPTQLNAVKNGRFLEGISSNWTSSGATVTLVSTGTPPDDTPYIYVDVSGGADSSSGGVNFSQSVAIPDTWPAGPVTLSVKFYIESYGVGASNLRYVDIAGSFGTNFRFPGNDTYTHPLNEWRTAFINASIGTGTGRTFTVRISSTSGNKTPIMRFSDFVLAPGTELCRESLYTGTRISERTDGIGVNGRIAMATTSLASPANGDFWYDGSDFKVRAGGSTIVVGSGGGGGGGSVTSVGLSLPSMFSVTGSPVTTSGTLTASLASQSAGNVFAAPGGSSGPPSFQQLVNAHISSSAAIALSKLATVTTSRALVSDGSGYVSAASVTSTELGYVSGVTSAIQTQLNAKLSTAVTSATGTTNQINVSAATGAVTFSLPQNIHTGATPQFAGLGIGAASGGSGELARINGGSYTSLLIDSANTTGPGLTLKNTGAGGREFAMLSTGSTAGIGVGKFGLFDTTASAYRWHVDASGNFLASTDATYDLGASGANRYRDAYFSRNVSASTGNLGGAAISGTNRLSITDTDTATSGDRYGVFGYSTVAPASTSTANYNAKATAVYANTGSNITGTIRGFLNQSLNIGAGTVAAIYGGEFFSGNSGAGTTTSAVGIRATAAQYSGTITSGAAFQALVQGGATGTAFEVVANTATTKYGLIVPSGHGLSGCGTTTPAHELHAVSASTTREAFKAESATLSTVPAAIFKVPAGVAPIQFDGLNSGSSYTSGLQPLGVDASGYVYLHEPVLTVNNLGPTIAGLTTIDVDEAYAFNWTARHNWKLGTTPQAAVQLEMTTRTTDGNSDSHYLEWISKHRSSSVNATGNWRAFADAVDNSGGSNLVFRGAVDNTGYTTALTLNQSGDVAAGRAFILTQMTDAAAPNGALYFSTTGSKAAVKDFSGTVNYLY